MFEVNYLDYIWEIIVIKFLFILFVSFYVFCIYIVYFYMMDWGIWPVEGNSAVGDKDCLVMAMLQNICVHGQVL